MSALIEEIRITKRLPSPADAKALRVAAGVSLVRMAREVGVSGAALLAWERGRYRPRGAHRAAYVHLLEELSREVESA